MARVLWLYCMRLASSGVGGDVRRVQLYHYHGMLVAVSVSSWMYCMRLASSGVGCVHRVRLPSVTSVIVCL